VRRHRVGFEQRGAFAAGPGGRARGDAPAAHAALECARRMTELARSALDLGDLLDAHRPCAGLRVERELGCLAGAPDVQRALGEHEIVAVHVVGVAGAVVDLHESPDAVEDAFGDDDGGDNCARASLGRRDDLAAKRLAAGRSRRCRGRGDGEAQSQRQRGAERCRDGETHPVLPSGLVITAASATQCVAP